MSCVWIITPPPQALCARTNASRPRAPQPWPGRLASPKTSPLAVWLRSRSKVAALSHSSDLGGASQHRLGLGPEPCLILTFPIAVGSVIAPQRPHGAVGSGVLVCLSVCVGLLSLQGGGSIGTQQPPNITRTVSNPHCQHQLPAATW